MKKSMSLVRSAFFLSALIFSVVIFTNVTVNASESIDVPSVVSFSNDIPGKSPLYSIERDVFNLINQQRRKYRLNALDHDSKLADLARYYSRKMAHENFFSHYDLDGNSLIDRAEKFDISNWRKLGENLFFCQGYVSPSQIALDGWRKSPAHWKNILDRDWTHTGIGVYETKNGKTYITQVFMKK